MRRIPLVLIGVILVICGLVIVVRPVFVLPTITVPVSENNTISAYQRKLGINELDVIIRTDGKITLTADGRQLAGLSYTPVSLNNTSDLAEQMFLPPAARTAMRLFPFLFPQLESNVYLASLCMYYVFPAEMTIRIVGR